MSDELGFAPDLYRGTAGYYDRYRLSYPPAMTTDLVRRTQPSGRGRLLDLACGTGQLAFALRDQFAEVWAVDQEPDMVEAVAAKATALGAGHIRPVVAAAEDLRADPDSFELAVIGNAFHRLRRAPVARLLLGWLQPGGFLALCWSSATQLGHEDWQPAFGDLLRRWQEALGARDRVPVNWDQPQREHPDAEVLADAGFEIAGRYEFPTPHSWTVAELAGYVRSLSICRRPCSGTAGPSSTRTWPPRSPRTQAMAASPRRSASCTSWPASRRSPHRARKAPKVSAMSGSQVTFSPYVGRPRGFLLLSGSRRSGRLAESHFLLLSRLIRAAGRDTRRDEPDAADGVAALGLQWQPGQW